MGKDSKLSALEVLTSFFDENTFVETDAYLKGADGEAEAVTGYGYVDGVTVYAFAQDVAVSGGAMSTVQAKKIMKLYKSALKTGAPIVGFYDSIGGKLSQQNDLLNAYGEILKSSSKLSGVVPQISVILGSCLGTSALIASSADFVVMTKDAELSIDTTGKNSCSGCNTKSGVASVVTETAAEAIDKAKTLLSYLPSNNLEPAPAFDSASAYESPDKFVKNIADEDSLFCVGCGYGENSCTAFGRVDGLSVGFVVTKGGDITADDAAKIFKMVRFCDAFSIPVITVADALKFTSLKSAAGVVSAYAEATTAKISIITGTAVGAVYIALAGASANADAVYATADAVVSPVSPIAAAFIMDESIANVPVDEQDAKAEAFVRSHLTAAKAAEDGYIDDIVDASSVRTKVASMLEVLSSKRVATLPKKHTTIL